MSADEAGFMAKICAEPGEDTHRLVYADWLQERGQGLRAEFIRVQIEAAVLERPGSGADPKLGVQWDPKRGRHVYLKPPDFGRLEILRQRAKRFLEYHSHEWFAAPPVHVPEPAYFAQWWGDVRRGFRERITCNAGDWLAHADAIRVQHPITRVQLTTWPDDVRHPTGMWFADDPKVKFFTWDAVTAEVRPGDQSRTRDQRHTLAALRLRWPGITFEVPA